MSYSVALPIFDSEIVLFSHQALLLKSKSTMWIISKVIWLVTILKSFMPKYCLNFSTSHTTAKHSCSVIEYFFSCSLKILLVQTIIYSFLLSLFWCKTAPIPSPDVFVYKINGLSKSEYVITDMIASLVFIVLNAFCLTDIYLNGTGLPFSFQVSSLIISQNLFIYCR